MAEKQYDQFEICGKPLSYINSDKIIEDIECQFCGEIFKTKCFL